MKLAESSRRVRSLALSSLLALLLAGCVNQNMGTRSATHTAILEAAGSAYNYDGERPPRDTTIPSFRGRWVANNEIPKMWVATMTLKDTNSRPQRRLQARIRSEGAYPLLGIERGINYVWTNKTDSTFWVTPAREGAPDHRIVRDSLLDRVAMPNHQPGLLRVIVNSAAIVFCSDDCPRAGHCILY